MRKNTITINLFWNFTDYNRLIKGALYRVLFSFHFTLYNFSLRLKRSYKEYDLYKYIYKNVYINIFILMFFNLLSLVLLLNMVPSTVPEVSNNYITIIKKSERPEPLFNSIYNAVDYINHTDHVPPYKTFNIYYDRYTDPGGNYSYVVAIRGISPGDLRIEGGNLIVRDHTRISIDSVGLITSSSAQEVIYRKD